MDTKKLIFALGAVLTLLLTPLSAQAAGLRVLALYPGKAMVAIDGKRVLLKEGKAGPNGVTLISADSEQAVIEVDGQREVCRLGSHIGASFNARAVKEAKIARYRDMGYLTDGAINGRMVKMLVDTGASVVAMSEDHARTLGVQYENAGRRTRVNTASGNASAYEITLDHVQVGTVKVPNVRAVVIQGNYPVHVLLGMSFLNEVDMDNKGEYLVLRSRI